MEEVDTERLERDSIQTSRIMSGMFGNIDEREMEKTKEHSNRSRYQGNPALFSGVEASYKTREKAPLGRTAWRLEGLLRTSVKAIQRCQ
jgi:hypothetical protein